MRFIVAIIVSSLQWFWLNPFQQCPTWWPETNNGITHEETFMVVTIHRFKQCILLDTCSRSAIRCSPENSRTSLDLCGSTFVCGCVVAFDDRQHQPEIQSVCFHFSMIVFLCVGLFEAYWTTTIYKCNVGPYTCSSLRVPVSVWKLYRNMKLPHDLTGPTSNEQQHYSSESKRCWMKPVRGDWSKLNMFLWLRSGHQESKIRERLLSTFYVFDELVT